jgi:hypothetical protein
MFDLVSLAHARRQMTDGNRKAQLVDQSLEFELPEAESVSIAASTVGRRLAFLRK